MQITNKFSLTNIKKHEKHIKVTFNNFEPSGVIIFLLYSVDDINENSYK